MNLRFLFVYLAIFAGANAKQDAWSGWAVGGGFVFSPPFIEVSQMIYEEKNINLPPLLPYLSANRRFVWNKIGLSISPLRAILALDSFPFLKDFGKGGLLTGLLVPFDVNLIINEKFSINIPAFNIVGAFRGILSLGVSWMFKDRWSLSISLSSLPKSIVPLKSYEVREGEFTLLLGASICRHF